MSKLRPLSSEDVLRALKEAGFEITRQRGSHVRLKHRDGRVVTVPMHKEIGRGLLRKIIRDAELSVEEFLNLL
ncbi:type II toxin-antitoxin system HicA family toxin [Thermodesulforhabdus norvegica]|uniref:Predicted RNA binding protein YcfA, dsRBD-like fold, HicA-like mRNA interferase family n=1 Tax=Thermodesulforhabdus norvegica TaxID=39841 RepID=A0A1I4TW98_9BACT|nr:type II toxin-antitoxin system HicA family toxin [Thermodesulforhabdus norvegica]SFM81002.1 Predicted RNA binding protein YcfA, dsRBD-like fold, HicA-like mRNA interferase family [Thermodesulforhabdus norvegica]